MGPTDIVSAARRRAAAKGARPPSSRRSDALEINDAIVQGLTVIKYALELGDVELARRKTDQTLAAARRVITTLLTEQYDDHVEPLEPGSMVRRTAAHAEPEPGTRP